MRRTSRGRLAIGYGSQCVRVWQNLAIAESQLRDYRERVSGKPDEQFGYGAYQLCEFAEALQRRRKAESFE